MASNEGLRSAMVTYMSNPCNASSSHLLDVISQVPSQALRDAVLANRSPADPNRDAADLDSGVSLHDVSLTEQQSKQTFRVLTFPIRNEKLAVDETLLGFVIKYGYSDIAMCILQKFDSLLESVLPTGNEYGETPVYHAAYNGDIAMLTAMLKPLSSTQIKNVLTKADSNGYTPLHAAAYLGHKEAITCVLGFVNKAAKWKLLALKSNKKHTVIATAAWADQSEVVLNLLDMLDLETAYTILAMSDTNGWTVLHLAAYHGHTKTLQTITEFLSAQQHEMSVRLNGIALDGSEDCNNYLLNLRNADGKTALRLAKENENSHASLSQAQSQTQTQVPLPNRSKNLPTSVGTTQQGTERKLPIRSVEDDRSISEASEESTRIKSGQQSELFKFKENKTNKIYEDVKSDGADINNSDTTNKLENIQDKKARDCTISKNSPEMDTTKSAEQFSQHHTTLTATQRQASGTPTELETSTHPHNRTKKSSLTGSSEAFPMKAMKKRTEEESRATTEMTMRDQISGRLQNGTTSATDISQSAGQQLELFKFKDSKPNKRNEDVKPNGADIKNSDTKNKRENIQDKKVLDRAMSKDSSDMGIIKSADQQQGLFRIKANKTNKRYEDIRHNGADINNHYAIHKCERIQSELKTFSHESQIPEHGATTIPPNTTPEGSSRSYAPKRVHTKKSSGSLIQSLTQSLEEAKKLKSDEAKMSAAERSMEARELISTKSASQREEDMETGGHDFAQSVATLEDDVLAALGSFRRHHKLPARGKEEHSGRKTHLKRKVPVPPPKPAQTLRVQVAGDDSQLRNQLEHFIQQRTDSTSSQDAMTESCVDWVMVEERPPTPPVAEQPIVQDSNWIETTRRMFST